MSRAVLPKASARELWLLIGQPDRDGLHGNRACPVDEDGDSEAEENEDGDAAGGVDTNDVPMAT